MPMTFLTLSLPVMMMAVAISTGPLPDSSPSAPDNPEWLQTLDAGIDQHDGGQIQDNTTSTSDNITPPVAQDQNWSTQLDNSCQSIDPEEFNKWVEDLVCNTKLKQFVKPNPSGHDMLNSVKQSIQQLQTVHAKAVHSDPNQIPIDVRRIFAQYEVPMGLLDALLQIRTFDRICFLIDDSGTMTTEIREMNEQELMQLNPSKRAEIKKQRDRVQQTARSLDCCIRTIQFLKYMNVLEVYKRQLAEYEEQQAKGAEMPSKPQAPTPVEAHACRECFKTYAGFDLGDTYGSPCMRTNQQVPVDRWTEALHQILTMLEIMQYLAKPVIEFHFLNDLQSHEPRLVLEQGAGESPKQFYQRAKKLVFLQFANVEQLWYNSSTPLLQKATGVFDRYKADPNCKRVLHYWFLDGVPTGPSIDPVEDVKGFLYNRHGLIPSDHLITFVSCSSDPADIQWMKDIEGVLLYAAEVDDFGSESKEIEQIHGTLLPFTAGIYFCCLLVAANFPHTLDALDEMIPFTKYTVESMYGVPVRDDVYKTYFDRVVAKAGDELKFMKTSRAVFEFFRTQQQHARFNREVKKFCDERLRIERANFENALKTLPPQRGPHDLRWSSNALPSTSSSSSWASSSKPTTSHQQDTKKPSSSPVQSSEPTKPASISINTWQQQQNAHMCDELAVVGVPVTPMTSTGFVPSYGPVQPQPYGMYYQYPQQVDYSQYPHPSAGYSQQQPHGDYQRHLYGDPPSPTAKCSCFGFGRK